MVFYPSTTLTMLAQGSQYVRPCRHYHGTHDCGQDKMGTINPHETQLSTRNSDVTVSLIAARILVGNRAPSSILRMVGSRRQQKKESWDGNVAAVFYHGAMSRKISK
jgi:hypothetical protein